MWWERSWSVVLVRVSDELRRVRKRTAGARAGAPLGAPLRRIPWLDELHRGDLLFELFNAQLDVLRRHGLLRLLFGSLGLLVVLAHDSARFGEGGDAVERLVGAGDDLD